MIPHPRGCFWFAQHHRRAFRCPRLAILFFLFLHVRDFEPFLFLEPMTAYLSLGLLCSWRHGLHRWAAGRHAFATPFRHTTIVQTPRARAAMRRIIAQYEVFSQKVKSALAMTTTFRLHCLDESPGSRIRHLSPNLTGVVVRSRPSGLPNTFPGCSLRVIQTRT